jgi:hypothetical protein
MISYSTVIRKFEKKGEKSGWTYVLITESQASALISGQKTSFRVRGKLDSIAIEKTAVLPMGDGSFILPLNLKIRKALGKSHGETVRVMVETDKRKLPLSQDLLASLKEEPSAFEHFTSLPPSHQQYFSKWIEEARTIETKTRRIVMAVMALSSKKGFGEMMRDYRDQRY